MSDAALAVANSLRVIATFTHSKGARLAFLNQNWRSHQTVYSWPEEAGEPHSDSQKKPDFWFQSRWWIDQIRKPKSACYQDVETLPEEARADLGWLSDVVLKGLCLLPIYDGKRLGAILQLDNPSEDHPLRTPDIQIISTASATMLHLIFDSTQEMGIFSKSEPQELDLNALPSEQSKREFFKDLLKEVIRRKGRLFGVLLVEMENLSSVAQNYPPEVRKLVVKTAIERIRSCLRVSDIVMELDRDQVGVMVVDVFETECARNVTERIQDAFKPKFHLMDRVIKLNALVGIAMPEPGENCPEQLMAEAEQGLALAKGFA